MNTLFEVFVRSDDEEHAEASAEAALDEVQRVEAMLSRFDPASEVFRVNREASLHGILLSIELMQLLTACEQASHATFGRFDITAKSRQDGAMREGPAVLLDSQTRRLRFTSPQTFLDFGSCGKGYALDKAAAVLRAAGIEHALLHGGGSSVLAIGRGVDDRHWRVDVADPWAESDYSRKLGQVELSDQALSTSWVFQGDASPGRSDIIDPVSNAALTRQAGCVAIATGPDAGFMAEVYSTALLALGREGAEAVLCRATNAPLVAWLSSELEWLNGPIQKQE